MARSALHDRGGGMGTAVAASGYARIWRSFRWECSTTEKGHSHQRGADYVFCAGRSGLDGFAAAPFKSDKDRGVKLGPLSCGLGCGGFARTWSWGAVGAGVSAAARGFVLCRYCARDGQVEGGDRNG